MLPPNWVLMAVPTCIAALGYLIICKAERIRERRYLRAVFDGERIAKDRADKRQARLAGRSVRYLTNRKTERKRCARWARRF